MRLFKLFVPIFLSIILIVLDARFSYLDSFKRFTLTLLSPIYLVVDLPSQVIDWINDKGSENELLVSQNDYLEGQLIELKAKLQTYNNLTLENQKLSNLLEASYLIPEHNVKLARIKSISQSRLSKKIIINKGVLSTNELNIKAPSANIRMEGSIDFVDETQDLHVIIEPKVSDTITAGALVGGPLAAAAAFIAQKILDDPFNKITTAEYHITGSWDDPKEKIVDTKVDNFIEDSILNPAGDVLDGVGGVINDFIIQPAEELNN